MNPVHIIVVRDNRETIWHLTVRQITLVKEGPSGLLHVKIASHGNWILIPKKRANEFLRAYYEGFDSTFDERRMEKMRNEET